MTRNVAAVDLGATSGRVIIGTLSDEPRPRVHLEQVTRFPNEPLTTTAGLQWDLPTLIDNVRLGVRRAHEKYSISSLGVDSWGVDYALLTGKDHSTPFHY